MEPIVRDTLRQLIARYGHSLCDDPRRCEAMLRDLCGQHKREVFILVSALRQRVAADLLAGSSGLPTPLLLGRLRQRLEDELALTGEAARWAVETWALVLGVIAVPVPLTAVGTAPSRGQTPANRDTTTPPTDSPLSRFVDRLTDGSEGPEMVRLPPGRFLMGAAAGDHMASRDERPQHEVRIARPFAIGRFPVTFADYDRFVAATNRQSPGDRGWGRGRRPVINVSWNDARAYCIWLTGQTGRTYRLPSEAEWEYAGRAGTATRWSCGDDEKLGDCAWFFDNSGGRTHPVGEKRPNHWGLHDIHGNVWEWVQDCWHDDYAGAPVDGSAWGTSSDIAGRVLRGGSRRNIAWNTRVSYRNRFGPDDRDDTLGLRLAQDL